jgi:hypothetical protein
MMASDGRAGTKTDKENRAQVGDSLERWYAERGSRVFDGTSPSTPRLICDRYHCGEPAKRLGNGAACADHWPKVVS